MLTSNAPVRLVIADDHAFICKGLTDFLTSFEGLRVVGIAANGREALNLVETHAPDVLITDIKMPVMDGRELCKAVRKRYPGVAIISHTMFESIEALVDMQTVGAKGHVVKCSPPEEMVEAVKAVYAGGKFYCLLTKKMMSAALKSVAYRTTPDKDQPTFTDVERDVARLIYKQCSAKEMATKLKKSEHAVNHCKERLQAKMNVKNSTGIALYVSRHWMMYEE